MSICEGGRQCRQTTTTTDTISFVDPAFRDQYICFMSAKAGVTFFDIKRQSINTFEGKSLFVSMNTIAFCSVLFCSVLFCSVLFCSVLFCSFVHVCVCVSLFITPLSDSVSH
jgi:hypothetical protein